MNLKKLGITFAIVASLCIGLTSCNSRKVKDTQAQQQIEYVLLPGVQVKVENGIATFTGTFPDEENLKKAEQVAKSNKYIKSIVNQATVQATMQLTTDTISTAAR